MAKGKAAKTAKKAVKAAKKAVKKVAKAVKKPAKAIKKSAPSKAPARSAKKAPARKAAPVKKTAVKKAPVKAVKKVAPKPAPPKKAVAPAKKAAVKKAAPVKAAPAPPPVKAAPEKAPVKAGRPGAVKKTAPEAVLPPAPTEAALPPAPADATAAKPGRPAKSGKPGKPPKVPGKRGRPPKKARSLAEMLGRKPKKEKVPKRLRRRRRLGDDDMDLPVTPRAPAPRDTMSIAEIRADVMARYLAGETPMCPVGCGGMAQVVRVSSLPSGAGDVWLECLSCAQRERFEIPAPTAQERQTAFDQLEAGNEPLCPRHGGRWVQLRRRGRDFACPECGILVAGRDA